MYHTLSETLKVFILIISSFLLISSDELNEDFNCRYAGNLTGWDASRCSCCGGWKIEIEGQNYLADSIPDKSQVLSPKDTVFPIPVVIDFKKAELCSNRITITCIKKR